MPDSTETPPRRGPRATRTVTPQPELTDGILAEGSDTHSPTEDPKREGATAPSGDRDPA